LKNPLKAYKGDPKGVQGLSPKPESALKEVKRKSSTSQRMPSNFGGLIKEIQRGS
jgi:hypothetical protein